MLKIPKDSDLRKLEPYILPAIVMLVGVGAFGLGRLSVSAPALSADKSTSPAALPAGEDRIFVGSKTGSVYYLPTCTGASRIKPENQVWFGTAEEARAAGYAPASNCPGL